jgi:hypothetical protein
MAEQEESGASGAIEVPAPTAWPMIAALGVTLLCAGLVTHVTVSAVGLLLLVGGGVGWFREVLPAEHREIAAAEKAPAVVPAARAVLRLQAGELRHRLRYPAEIYPYSAGIKGGLAGAAVMAGLACLYGLLAYGSLWYPINLLAAATSAKLAAATPAELAVFNAEGLALAFVTHAVISVLVGLLYGVLLPMFPWHPLFSGGVVAPLVWTGLIWSSLRVIDPVLAARIDWSWFVASQVGFGLAAGAVVTRTEKIATMQHLPLAMRAGVEATGLPPVRDEERRR